MNSLRYAYFSLTIAGIVAAIYDAWTYTTHNWNSCTVGNTIWSCGGVGAWANAHPISIVGLSIPYWTTGLVWFPLALIVGLLAFKYDVDVVLVPFLMIGNIFTIYLWYLELGVIHLICPTCTALDVINYILTTITVVIIRQTS